MELQALADNSTRASNLLRIMSNEKRLMILCNLLEGECSVKELQKATGLGQSTVSQQLAILRAEKIIRHRRQAQSVFYTLDSSEASAIIETLYDLFCAKKTDTCR